jgi:hypothetical protein
MYSFVVYMTWVLLTILQAYSRGNVNYSPEPKIIHKTHLPSRIVDVFDDARGVSGSREDAAHQSFPGDEKTGEHRTPRFHLLVVARQSGPSLCRTLLSAAALNYPPPVLVGYSSGKDERGSRGSSIGSTYDFLNGGEVQDDDLIIIVEDGTAALFH